MSEFIHGIHPFTHSPIHPFSMRQPLERRVVRVIRKHRLAEPRDRIAVAISGGSDSVALTWILHEVAADLGVTLAGLIHVNHGLRGRDAELDEAFCRALAERLAVPIEVRRVDVAALARSGRRSIEAAGREARYACFTEAAARLGATRVATGHTLDDQAETMLLRLFRGAGTRGLTGIRIRRGQFVRPLLQCRRGELVDYLTSRSEPYREDASNADCRIPRNRVRHELLPVIDRMAPGARRALGRLAAISADDESFFREAVIRLAPSVVLPDGRIRLSALVCQPPAIARRLLRFVAEARCDGGAALNAMHLDAVLRLAKGPRATGRLDLPGLCVERDHDLLMLRPAGDDRATAQSSGSQFEYSLPCPGVAVVPEAGVTVLAQLAGSGQRDLNNRGDVVAIEASSFSLPFVVRSRRDGDRLRPLGAPGQRKLPAVLVDRKVPRQDRDRLPIVTDIAGRIVWVAGVTIVEEGRVRTPGEGVVILTVKKGLQ